MLLEFKMKNFKSFRDLSEFKMIPAPKIKDLEYSLLKANINDEEIKVIPTSVIYGPNSSGKTNLIGGIQVFRSIVLRGNIKDTENITSMNVATDRLNFVPHIESEEDEPIYFYVKFLTEGMVFEFSLKFTVGGFSTKPTSERKILEEELKIDGNDIYSRKEELTIKNIKYLEEKNLLIENFHEKVAKDIIKSNIEPQELLLNVMFKSLYSKKVYEIISNWFEGKLLIMYHSDKMHYTPDMMDNVDIKQSGKKFFSDVKINKAIQQLGLTSEKIAYPITEKKNLIRPLSVIKLKNEKGTIIPAEFFESYGTIRLLDIFPIMLGAMKTGATLFMDELDASIHPMVVMSIIKIFHNDDINKNGAQLIFNTHNPIFLNKNLFRRDEIKFVEKDDKESILYALSDFGTSGKTGVRNSEDYMKNYFVDKYGAITDVDFSEVFENYMNDKKE